MRVRQLAKDLGITITRLEKFLSNNLEMEQVHNPNLKLEDDAVNKAIAHFGLKEKPVVSEIKSKISNEKLSTISEDISDNDLNNEIKSEEIKTPQISVDFPSNIGVDEEKSKDDISETKIVETGETTLHIKNGVITAPKVELKGITIKGKIDLPSPKVVENNEEKNSSIDDDNELKGEKKEEKKIIPVYTPKPKNKKIINKNSSIPVEPTLQEIKEKEKAELEKRLAQQKEYQEKIRKEHYFKEIQPKTKKVPKKKKKEAIEKNNEVINQESNKIKENEPTSAWGKFIAWLNN